MDKYDSFVVYEQNVVIRQAKNTKSTDLLEKNYDSTDVESTSNCFNAGFYGDVERELAPTICSEPITTYKNEDYFVKEPSIQNQEHFLSEEPEQMFYQNNTQDYITPQPSVSEVIDQQILYDQTQSNQVINEDNLTTAYNNTEYTSSISQVIFKLKVL